MAYTKNPWVEPKGSYLNRFKKQNETDTSVELIHDPSLTNAPTPFSIENMNRIEQGIYDAHLGIAGLSDTLTSHADMVDGMGRNLLTVLGVGSIQAAMDALSVRCNGTGTPNFRGLMIGDYIDGIDLSAIPAENGGDAGQAWNGTYKNNRIVLSGFNTCKGNRNTKNHILFIFLNAPMTKRMNPTDTNAGGYPASELRAFLEGGNGDGTGDYTGSTTVTTAAFLNALKAQIGNHLYTHDALLSQKGFWDWYKRTVFLPTECEIYGTSILSETQWGAGFQAQFPVYQKSAVYKNKRYNGMGASHWQGTPANINSSYFCYTTSGGGSNYNPASTVIGCSPAFCTV